MKRLTNLVIALSVPAILVLFFVSFVVIPLERLRKETDLEIVARISENARLKAKIIALLDDEQVYRLPPELVWRNATRAEAETALQRMVLDRAKETGLLVTRIGAASSQPGSPREKVNLDLELEGTLEDCARFLRQMEDASPKLAVSSLTLRKGAFREEDAGETLVFLRVVFWGYWEGKQE